MKRITISIILLVAMAMGNVVLLPVARAQKRTAQDVSKIYQAALDQNRQAANALSKLQEEANKVEDQKDALEKKNAELVAKNKKKTDIKDGLKKRIKLAEFINGEAGKQLDEEKGLLAAEQAKAAELKKATEQLLHDKKQREKELEAEIQETQDQRKKIQQYRIKKADE